MTDDREAALIAACVVSAMGSGTVEAAPVLTGIHKIQHVIVIMQENHSFDNYFGVLPYVSGSPYHPGPCAKTDHQCVDGLTCAVNNCFAQGYPTKPIQIVVPFAPGGVTDLSARMIGERLRQHLGIERWIVFGGSWGSTLALAYGEAHPGRCLGFVLRGIFLCRPSEIEWFLYGLKNIFPDAWDKFVAPVPPAERADLLSGYYNRLMDPDPAIHMPAARAWGIYEGSCSTLLPSPDTVAHFASDVVALGLARLEAHYFRHNIFLPPDSLLQNVDRLRHLPAVIVQGRYDAVCPIVSAHDLHRAWPEAEYIVVPDAGHSAWEPGIAAELVMAMERFKTI